MKRLLLALIFPFALFAQSPYVQGGSVNAAPDTIYAVTGSWAEGGPVYHYTFPQLLTSPCTILVSIRGNAAYIVSDSENNTYAVATRGNGGQLWYSTSCFAGADTVSVTCSSNLPCWSQFTVSQYAGVWVPDQVSPQIVNFNGSTVTTVLITPTQNGELVIGFGNNSVYDKPSITVGTGWTLRANANAFIEDMVQSTAGPIASSASYVPPTLSSITTVSFMPGGPPPPPPPIQWFMQGLGTITFPMYIPPACGPSDGTCSIQVQVCDNATPANCMTGALGQLTIIKTVSLPTPQVQKTVVATVTP